MDNSDDAVAAAPKRPNFTPEYRRSIVALTMQPGASVSRIAREHGLNDNMVFKWRHRFRKELETSATVSVPVAVSTEPTQLVPVSIVDAPSPLAKETITTSVSGCEVEIEAGKRRVRIRGVSLEFAERFLRDCLK